MKAVHVVLYFVALARPATGQLVRKNIFVDKQLTWTDAQAYCRTYHEDLSTVNTPWDFLKFQRDVEAYLSKEGWVGLSKDSLSPVYIQWSDGSLLGVPLWKLGKPSNVMSYHCVTIRNMELADYDCTKPLMFFCYAWMPKMVLVEEMMSWEEALHYCRTHHADLISASTDYDLQVGKSTSITSQTSRVWTGLRFMDSSWFWVNKDPLGNLTSMPSCPIKPYHCGALKAGDDVWENRDCNEKMNFLCNN